MPTYLNHRAILQCTHGGRVVFVPPPYRSLYVTGSPVVTDVDLLEAFIVGCAQIGPGLKPCTRVIFILAGRAQLIDVDRQIPLLDTLRALTDGVGPGIVTAITDGDSNAQTQPLLAQIGAMTSAALRGAALCEIC